MAKEYDVIVVGGGPGGLTCAALLAKWGLKTLLVDQNETTGGKAVTVERDGFRYELAPKLQVPMRGPAFETAFKLLGIESEFKPIYLEQACLAYRSSRSDKYRTTVTHQKETGTDPEEFFDLFELDAGERERALGLLTDIALMSPEKLSDLDDMTFDEFLAQYDVPSGLYSYLAMHSNASLAEPIDLVSASEQALILQQIAMCGGGGYYVGGFGRMLDAIADTIKANGGEVRTRTRVEKISVEDGRVTGLVTREGDFKAPVIVSNAGIQPTVLKLVGEEHFDRGYVNYVKDLVPGWSFTAVKYFLNKPVLKWPMYMMWADDSWLTTERFLKIKQGHVPEEVILFGIVPSNFDPTMSPSGKQCFIAGTICSPDPEATEIQMIYDKMDEMLNRVFPEAMDAVESKEFEGPAEISRSTRDHVLPGQGGECVGLAQIVGQCGKHKPSPGAPVRGLYYVGCDAGGSGMGTHQAAESGINVARMVVQYHRKRLASQ
ncbi:MAG: FAD-dependent oxidoreductase [Dehalococcoidia bacterium]